MATPYEVVVGGLNVTGGQTNCFPIPFPSRTFLGKVIVAQTGGPGSNFTVNVYNRAAACQRVSITNDQGDGPGPDVPALYLVMPPMTSAYPIHFVSAFASGGLGWPFFNMDGDVGFGNPRMIYVQIAPLGIGVKEFAVCINGANDLN